MMGRYPHPGVPMTADTDQPDAAFPLNERGRAFQPGLADDDKTWAMFAHLGLLGHLVIPLFAIAIPLVIWLTKKDKSAFIDDHAREALNFQITLIIYSVTLPLIAGIIGAVTCGIGFILMVPAVVGPYILGLIGMIMAAMAANRGEYYRYPMTFRFIH